MIDRHIEPNRNHKILVAEAQLFQQYVTENSIASTDWEAISSWVSLEGNLFVLHTATSQKSEAESTKSDNAHDKGKSSDLQENLPIQFQDATVETNFLFVKSNLLQRTMFAFACVISALLFIAMFYHRLKKKLDYILEIESGIAILESGDLGYQIPQKGTDELNRLATSVNVMSKSFNERILAEQQAIQTSREIITELSHDIRTPLTIFSGYIPLLLESKPLSVIQKEYLRQIENKTEQMKTRVNELLDYSVLFSGKQKYDQELLSGETIFMQLIGEISPFVTVDQQNMLSPDVKIAGDYQLIARVFDNIVSNIYQHGDLTKPVFVSGSVHNNHLHIETRNTVRSGETVIGKSLGSTICQYILQIHGGKMLFEKQGDIFKSEMAFPLCDKI